MEKSTKNTKQLMIDEIKSVIDKKGEVTINSPMVNLHDNGITIVPIHSTGSEIEDIEVSFKITKDFIQYTVDDYSCSYDYYEDEVDIKVSINDNLTLNYLEFILNEIRKSID